MHQWNFASENKKVSFTLSVSSNQDALYLSFAQADAF